MARVAGVEIPAAKRVEIALRYVYGIGPTLARSILDEAKIDFGIRTKNLTEDQVSRINDILDKRNIPVEGYLRRYQSQNIQRLKEIRCYRGVRHMRGLPVRGQRTRFNARTRKGPRKTVAGKKVVKGMK
jgi:small subunit ribosomal protein S13